MSERAKTDRTRPGPEIVVLEPRREASARRFSTTDLRRTQLAGVDRRALRPAPTPETPDDVEEILYDVLGDV